MFTQAFAALLLLYVPTAIGGVIDVPAIPQRCLTHDWTPEEQVFLTNNAVREYCSKAYPLKDEVHGPTVTSTVTTSVNWPTTTTVVTSTTNTVTWIYEVTSTYTATGTTLELATATAIITGTVTATVTVPAAHGELKARQDGTGPFTFGDPIEEPDAETPFTFGDPVADVPFTFGDPVDPPVLDMPPFTFGDAIDEPDADAPFTFSDPINHAVVDSYMVPPERNPFDFGIPFDPSVSVAPPSPVPTTHINAPAGLKALGCPAVKKICACVQTPHGQVVDSHADGVTKTVFVTSTKYASTATVSATYTKEMVVTATHLITKRIDVWNTAVWTCTTETMEMDVTKTVTVTGTAV